MTATPLPYVPYCYLISWTSLNKHYYGVQYCNTRYSIANPSNLWKNYWTSSKVVAKFREEHGEPTFIQTRRTFSTREEALQWESKVLRRLKADRHPYMLNKNVGDGKFVTGVLGRKRCYNVKTGAMKFVFPQESLSTGFSWNLPTSAKMPNKGKKVCHYPTSGAMKYMLPHEALPSGWVWGGPPKSPEHVAKIRVSNKGKKVSGEALKNVQKAAKLRGLSIRGEKHPRAKEVTLQGITYGSMKDAGEAMGVGRDAVVRYVNREYITYSKKCLHCSDTLTTSSSYSRYHGDNCRRNLKNPKVVPFTLNGVEYVRIRDVCEAFNVCHSTVSKWLKRGYITFSKVCPHCGKTMSTKGAYDRWHGDQCKHRPT